MARRQRESENPVSLFPFLAVLICAMGVLIFLLIVSTSRIRSRMLQQAIERQEQKEKPKATPNVVVENLPEPVLPSLSEIRRAPREIVFPSMIDPNYRIRQKVLRFKNELEKERENRNRQEGMLKSDNREKDYLKDKILAKRKLLDTAQGDFQKRLERIEQLSKKKTAVIRELFFLKKNIAEQNRKRAEVAGRFEIVPFEGRTGTTRRPILIECHERGLTFLPEGITLSLVNLEGFTINKNPLLSSVRILVSYWHRKDKAKSGDPNEPLPYVLLLVRPSGSLPFYAARKMLTKLEVPFGYELIEEDWKLAVPTADVTAKRLAQQAIRETIREGRFLTRRNSNGTGSNENEYLSSDGRSIRFHKNTGTFEVVESEKSAGRGFTSQSRDGKNESSSNRTFGERPERTSSSTGSRSERGIPRTQAGSIREPRRLGRSSVSERSRIGNGLGRNRNRSENRQNALPNSLIERKGDARLREATPNGRSSEQNPGNSRFDNPANIEEWRRTREHRRQNGNGRSSNSKNNYERDFFNTSQNGNRSRGTQRSSIANPRGSRNGQSSQGQSYSNNNLVPVPNPFSSGKTNPPTLEPMRTKSRWGFSSSRAMIGFEREVTIRVGEKFAKIGKEDFFAVSSEKNNANHIGQFVHAVEKHVRSWGHPPEMFYWIPSIRLIASPGGVRNAERLKSLAEKMRLPAKIEFPSDRKENQQGRRDDEK